jgi:cell division protein FtsX
LNANPLPHVLHVHPASDAESAASLDALRRYFAAWPEVDVVQIDAQWVTRFNAILEVLRRLAHDRRRDSRRGRDCRDRQHHTA